MSRRLTQQQIQYRCHRLHYGVSSRRIIGGSAKGILSSHLLIVFLLVAHVCLLSCYLMSVQPPRTVMPPWQAGSTPVMKQLDGDTVLGRIVDYCSSTTSAFKY